MPNHIIQLRMEYLSILKNYLLLSLLTLFFGLAFTTRKWEFECCRRKNSEKNKIIKIPFFFQNLFTTSSTSPFPKFYLSRNAKPFQRLKPSWHIKYVFRIALRFGSTYIDLHRHRWISVNISKRQHKRCINVP